MTRVFLPSPITFNKLNQSSRFACLYPLEGGFSTAYYPNCQLGKAKEQKTIPASMRIVYFNNSDGSQTGLAIPESVMFAGQTLPFPTCVQIKPVEPINLRLSLEALNKPK